MVFYLAGLVKNQIRNIIDKNMTMAKDNQNKKLYLHVSGSLSVPEPSPSPVTGWNLLMEA